MMFKKLLVVIMMAILLSACSPGSTGSGSSENATNTPSPTSTPQASPTTAPQPAPSATGSGSGGKDINTSAAVTAAQAKLAQQLGVERSAIKLVKSEKVQWPDGCLGVKQPGIMCTMMVTPGYRVILEAAGQSYEFHTDLTGDTVLLAANYLPGTANKDLVWEQTVDGKCTRAEIGNQGVAYGPCGGKLVDTNLQPARAAELSYLLATYQPFSAGTKIGIVGFNGQGQQEANAAEMRSVAEWARLVMMEAQGGRSGAAWGQAVAWRREGGIAGLCNDLAISVTGWATPSSCKPGQAKAYNNYRLTAKELETLYGWVDQYQNFEYIQQDPATADAMKTTLIFTGNGSQSPSAAQKDEIAQFAATLFTAATR